MTIFDEQMKIINKIIEIRDSNPEGFNPGFHLEIWCLCHQLEKLGNAPHIAEVERFRKLYLAASSKNIPNLNLLEKKYEK